MTFTPKYDLYGKLKKNLYFLLKEPQLNHFSKCKINYDINHDLSKFLNTFEICRLFFIKALNCLKFNGCNGSTADFFGFGCISIINPSHPAAIDAYVKMVPMEPKMKHDLDQILLEIS